VCGLHALYSRIEHASTAGRNVAKTSRRSLGQPSAFAIIDRKSRFATCYKYEALPLPKTVAARNRREFLRQLDTDGLTQVLKFDVRWGGGCVRIAAKAIAAFDELAAIRGWLWVLCRGPLSGATYCAVPRTASPSVRIIALHPGVFWRDQSSKYLGAPYHDIPFAGTAIHRGVCPPHKSLCSISRSVARPLLS